MPRKKRTYKKNRYNSKPTLKSLMKKSFSKGNRWSSKMGAYGGYSKKKVKSGSRKGKYNYKFSDWS